MNFNNLLKNSMKKCSETSIWVKFSNLAIETKSVNLGQGFPDWSPPDFYLNSLIKQTTNQNNHQYTRAFGSINLVKSIAKNHQKFFKEKLTEENILVTSGGVGGLYSTISALINPGDEVVLIEPFYDVYRPITIFSEGIVRPVALIPPKVRPLKDYINILPKDNQNIKTDLKDTWEFDFQSFSDSLNEKTKLIILNSPNNPTGKIYSYNEYQEISRIILKKSPNAVVLSDEVYEHIYFDNNKDFPRIANIDGMWERTLTLSSAGKIFSATGVRVGWLIGNKELIKVPSLMHQNTTFCMYDPIQNLIPDCLNEAELPYRGYNTYYDYYRDLYNTSRTTLFNHLLNTKNVFSSDEYKMNFFLREGAYFVVGNISNSKILKEYKIKGEEDKKYTKDMQYCVNLAYDKNVILIPLSVFYTPENKHIGENLVRIAFCKKPETLDSAFNNLKL